MASSRPRQRQTPNRRPTSPAAQTRAPRSAASRVPPPAPLQPRSFRARLEKYSYPLLVRLSRAPKLLLGAVTAGLLLGGLLAPVPIGPILLGIVVLFLLWLLALSWPKLPASSRAVRALVVAVTGGLVVVRAGGWV